MPLKSVSYLDLHIEIDNGGRLKIELVDKRDDFTFPIVNFPFITSNIPAAPAYGVYISELNFFKGTVIFWTGVSCCRENVEGITTNILHGCRHELVNRWSNGN